MRAVGAVAVADLEVHRIGGAAIDELMAVRYARRESRAHSGGEPLLAGFGAQHHLPLEHVHELVLVRVPVAHGGFLTGWQCRVVDADPGEPEGVADAPLETR